MENIRGNINTCTQKRFNVILPDSAIFYLYHFYSTYLKFHSDDTISLKYFKVRPNTRTNTDTMFYKYQFSSSRVGIP